MGRPAHFSGFSPRPVPKLIATAHTRGPALAISKGIDRDRAVDESGNQLAVFGRRGARPLNNAEIRSLYIHSRTGAPVFSHRPAWGNRNSHAETTNSWPWTALLRRWLSPGQDSHSVNPSQAQISALRLDFTPAYLKHRAALQLSKLQNTIHPL